jgi:ligand-binding sensor domain-containing protein
MRTELQEFVLSMETMSQTSGGEVSVYSTNKNLSEIVQFYQTHPPVGGWKRTLNLISPEKGGIMIWEKGDNSAQVLITEKEGKRIIIIGCSSKTASMPTDAIANFTEDDGLADSSITGIAVTSDGIAWFSTRSGVSRYDGEEWITYNKEDGLSGKGLTSVAVDEEGFPWVGTDQWGCCYYDGCQWTVYDQVKKVSSITIAPEGDVWIGSCDVSKGGVYHYDGQEWTWYSKKNGLEDNCVNEVAIGPDGIIWAATKKGAASFDGNTWKTYTEDDGLLDNKVNDVAVDREGRAWFATNNGVSCFDGQTWRTFTKEDGLIASKVKVITVAPDGSLWFGTMAGLSHLDGGQWYHYTEKEGLPDNKILSIFAAADGKIWIGTAFYGIAVLNPSQ